MIACDTSSLSAFLKGEAGKDVDRVASAIESGELALPPVVVTEILSDPLAGKTLDDLLPNFATLDLHDGYWTRAGHARRLVKRHNFKAKTADALIAQACIDNDVELITRDRDFRHFARHCGLKLAMPVTPPAECARGSSRRARPAALSAPRRARSRIRDKRR